MSYAFSIPAPSDYSALSQEVVFPANTTQRRVAILIVEDNVLEATEFFSVRVTVLPSYTGVVLLDTDVALISITDDDSKWLHWSAIVYRWLHVEVACNQWFLLSCGDWIWIRCV